MAKTLSNALITQKNLLSDPGAFLVLLHVDFNVGGVDDVYICLNTVDIEWNSQTWSAFPFELDIFRQTDDGSFNTIEIKISNIDRLMESTLDELENNGQGASVTLYIIHSEQLSEAAYIEQEFQVVSTSADEEWCYFEMGPIDLQSWMFPGNLFDRQNCRHQFKVGACNYSGSNSTCDRTFTTCIANSTEDRYGDFPAIPGGGFFPSDSGAIQAE